MARCPAPSDGGILALSTDSIQTGVFTSRLRRLSLDVPPRVLVVDDDELELELIADRLERAGLDVTRANDGTQALEILKSQDFPVMVFDWQMKVMDGIALTEKLRASGKLDAYIIMLTAKGSQSDYDRGYLAGVDDYLTKKLPDTELMARVHTGFNTVTLRLDLKKRAPASRSSNRAPAREPMSERDSLKHVLYVDDEPDIRLVASMALGLDPALRVDTADSGEQALALLPELKPDLVILDVMMPGLDGPSTLARMRADPDLQSIPVVFMTAKAMPEEQARFLSMGAAGVIPKPFDPMRLAGQVTELWTRLPS